MQVSLYSCVDAVKKIVVTKATGVSRLTNKYHLTRELAGLKGLYIVMIKSRHKQMFSNSDTL